MQKLLGLTRRAITDYNMISKNDHIAVGISGGKDSIALLLALHAYQKFSPIPFTLSAITINLGFDDTLQAEVDKLTQFISNLKIHYYIVETDIAKIVFDTRKESNPCSLCSKMRKGALNNKAIEIGANKVALGHHADDVAQTMLLSLLYEGRFSTFAPVSYLDKSKITLIRPLIYALEKDIENLTQQYDFSVVTNPCPANKNTKREYVNNLIKHIQNDVPFAKKNILSAIYHPERNKLWISPKDNNNI